MRESNDVKRSSMQKWALTCMIGIYAFVVVSMLMTLVFQGFNLFNFNIDMKFLIFPNVILMGMGAMLIIIFKSLFKKIDP